MGKNKKIIKMIWTIFALFMVLSMVVFTIAPLFNR